MTFLIALISYSCLERLCEIIHLNASELEGKRQENLKLEKKLKKIKRSNKKKKKEFERLK